MLFVSVLSYKTLDREESWKNVYHNNVNLLVDDKVVITQTEDELQHALNKCYRDVIFG